MHLEDSMLSDFSQPQENKYCVMPLTGSATFTDPETGRRLQIPRAGRERRVKLYNLMPPIFFKATMKEK